VGELIRFHPPPITHAILRAASDAAQARLDRVYVDDDDIVFNDSLALVQMMCWRLVLWVPPSYSQNAYARFDSSGMSCH
jgi:hypothetical protein